MSPRSRSTHLPRRPVTGSTADPRPSSSVSAADSLFALLRKRSTRGDFSTFSARFRHDAVQHPARQPRSAAGGSEGFHAAEGTGRALKSIQYCQASGLGVGNDNSSTPAVQELAGVPGGAGFWQPRRWQNRGSPIRSCIRSTIAIISVVERLDAIDASTVCSAENAVACRGWLLRSEFRF